MSAASPIALVGYPEKFELALRYGEGPLQEAESLTDSDRLIFYALSKQAQHGWWHQLRCEACPRTNPARQMLVRGNGTPCL